MLLGLVGGWAWWVVVRLPVPVAIPRRRWSQVGVLCRRELVGHGSGLWRSRGWFASGCDPQLLARHLPSGTMWACPCCLSGRGNAPRSRTLLMAPAQLRVAGTGVGRGIGTSAVLAAVAQEAAGGAPRAGEPLGEALAPRDRRGVPGESTSGMAGSRRGGRDRGQRVQADVAARALNQVELAVGRLPDGLLSGRPRPARFFVSALGAGRAGLVEHALHAFAASASAADWLSGFPPGTPSGVRARSSQGGAPQDEELDGLARGRDRQTGRGTVGRSRMAGQPRRDPAPPAAQPKIWSAAASWLWSVVLSRVHVLFSAVPAAAVVNA